MDALLVLLGLASLIVMVVGLIKPALVIRWGEKKTRPRVLMIYGGLFIVLLVALGMTGNSNSEKNVSKAVTKTEEAQVKPANEAVSKEETPTKYALGGARKLVMDWLGEHEFPNTTPLSLSPGDKLDLAGKKYHIFTLTGLHRAIDILVDPYTGELLFYDTGVQPKSLDKWYLEYKTAHKADFGKRINENFEWVEKPSMQNGYIVGKVKNISKKTFKYASIVFNLSDGSKNRIGSVAADIRSLKPGDIWSFQVSPALYQSMASYELEKVEGYEW